VKPSWLVGGGQGLFARRHIKQGTVVCKYFGNQLRTVDAIRLV
jgi:SET domain-containing protein